MSKPKRKLISKQLMRGILFHLDLGVPLSTIKRNLNLDISLVSLKKLLRWHIIAVQHSDTQIQNQILASLYPEWLIPDKYSVDSIHIDLTTDRGIQMTPNNYRYKGLFPFGVWVNADN